MNDVPYGHVFRQKRWFEPPQELEDELDVTDEYRNCFHHGEYMSYVFCGFILLGTVIHALRVLRERCPRTGLYVSRVPGVTFLAAVCRGTGYARISVFGRALPACKYLVIVGAFIIGVVLWVFLPRPHYYSRYEIGSPLLAIRAGMMAIGMVPFLFSLALKFNPISLLTGIPHSHLQLFHQAGAVVFFFLAIVHTVPFIWQQLREGGLALLKENWSENYVIYWSGTVCVFFLLWICASSQKIFRSMSYEFFVAQHIISFTLLLSFLFVHVQSLLESYVWVWTALGVWLFSIIGRSLMVLISTQFFVRAQSQVEVLASVGSSQSGEGSKGPQFIRMSFVTPLRWHPGQHVYVRFPGVAPTQAHPFSCLSLPSYSPNMPNRLVLMARVHKGITRRIYRYIMEHSEPNEQRHDSLPKSDAESAVLLGEKDTELAAEKGVPDLRSASFVAALDGPYGYTYSLGIYQHSVLFAAGSGITFCLPQVAELVRRAVEGKRAFLTKSVRLVWSVRTFDMMEWVRPELEELAMLAEQVPFDVQLDLYATRETNPNVDQELSKLVRIIIKQRPDIRGIIEKEAQQAMACKSESLSVSACGTDTMSVEVSNATARLNWRIAAGRLGSLRDVHLIAEQFGF